jgi:AraC-like DNA-binding protein
MMNPPHVPQCTMHRHRELLGSVEKGLIPARFRRRTGTQAFSVDFTYQRVFRSVIGETPSRLRRRLLLERAAYELRATQISITTIAFDANYKSLEGFSRAFKSAYELSPTEYRRATSQIRFLPSFSGVHYDPDSEGAISTLPGG